MHLFKFDSSSIKFLRFPYIYSNIRYIRYINPSELHLREYAYTSMTGSPILREIIYICSNIYFDAVKFYGIAISFIATAYPKNLD